MIFSLSEWLSTMLIIAQKQCSVERFIFHLKSLRNIIQHFIVWTISTVQEHYKIHQVVTGPGSEYR